MDVGKKYKVVYLDGSGQERVKELIFKERDNTLLIFINPLKNNSQEIINEKQIVRMEEVRNG